MRAPPVRLVSAGEDENQAQQKNEDSLRKRRKKRKRLVGRKATLRL